MPDAGSSPLAELCQRVCNDPQFCGYRLTHGRTLHEMAHVQVDLGLDGVRWRRVIMCSVPRADRFLQDVIEIAVYCEIEDVEKLAGYLMPRATGQPE